MPKGSGANLPSDVASALEAGTGVVQIPDTAYDLLLQSLDKANFTPHLHPSDKSPKKTGARAKTSAKAVATNASQAPVQASKASKPSKAPNRGKRAPAESDDTDQSVEVEASVSPTPGSTQPTFTGQWRPPKDSDEAVDEGEEALADWEESLDSVGTANIPLNLFTRVVNPSKAKKRGQSFRDRVRVHLSAARGGDGCVSFHRDKKIQRGPPDGGDGGRGGNIIVRASHQTPSLHHLRPTYDSGFGLNGTSRKRVGKRGWDSVIEVPPGTIVTPFIPLPKSRPDSVASEATSSSPYPPADPKVSRKEALLSASLDVLTKRGLANLAVQDVSRRKAPQEEDGGEEYTQEDERHTRRSAKGTAARSPGPSTKAKVAQGKQTKVSPEEDANEDVDEEPEESHPDTPGVTVSAKDLHRARRRSSPQARRRSAGPDESNAQGETSNEAKETRAKDNEPEEGTAESEESSGRKIRFSREDLDKWEPDQLTGVVPGEEELRALKKSNSAVGKLVRRLVGSYASYQDSHAKAHAHPASNAAGIVAHPDNDRSSKPLKLAKLRPLLRAKASLADKAALLPSAPSAAPGRGVELVRGSKLDILLLRQASVDLDVQGSFFVAARGGEGGLGNWRLAAVKNKPQAIATKGKMGQEAYLMFELKLIADVGLVGFPNAGKSTLLTAISRATPKVADYPFTTLQPHIGTVEFSDFTSLTVADLPGLIEGAHQNKGLGHDFLRHVERTSCLAYVLDLSGDTRESAYETLLTLRDELERYKPGLSKKAVMVVANKMDRMGGEKALAQFKRRLQASPDSSLQALPIFPISAKARENVQAVLKALHGYVSKARNTSLGEVAEMEAEFQAVASLGGGADLGGANSPTETVQTQIHEQTALDAQTQAGQSSTTQAHPSPEVEKEKEEELKAEDLKPDFLREAEERGWISMNLTPKWAQGVDLSEQELFGVPGVGESNRDEEAFASTFRPRPGRPGPK